MRLHATYARFFRSLNYDYIRASSDTYNPDPWDETPSGADYPFVRLRLRPDITTVVGGNESGKSQMLRAIAAALTGEGFDRSDFCRYSTFFGVDKALLLPEFGAEFSDVTSGDVATIEQMIGQENLGPVQRVAIFRMNTTPKFRIYLRQNGSWSGPTHIKTPKPLRTIGVPAPFFIDTDVPLPDSVPLEYLVTGSATTALGRNFLRRVWDRFLDNHSWFDTHTTVSERSSEIADAFADTRRVDDDELRKFALAADLLLKVADLDTSLFAELQKAVRTQNGYANSIVDTINGELAKALNFPHWWSQDSRFELFVALHEYHLIFMIRDRTGRSYGFDERSDGLKYFLSYFVQYLAHTPPDDGAPEILLMDEPDRFLSSSGQQDLLRVFEDFAHPRDPARPPVQVVYVTHSPFLIDKNDAGRIRVVEKGEFDEGTRVVASVAANHYEPLRSAFGGFVAETTFIGTCNLMLEGPSDQVLLAGVARWLTTRGVASRDRLDLNTITLVPTGGTRHVPYMVYLARGRDVEKPPVIVLLDGDKAGNEARQQLQAGGAYGIPLIDDRLVLQLTDPELASIDGDNPAGVTAIEDLIPFSIAVDAVKFYCEEFVPDIDIDALHLRREDLTSDTTKTGLLAQLETHVRSRSGADRFHLDKVAFARAVIATLTARSRSASEHPTPDADLDRAQHNFTLLLSALAHRQRQAVRAEAVDKISSRINRAKRQFLRTQRGNARREDVLALIEEISDQLDNSADAEDVRATTRQWRERFQLDDDPRAPIEDYPSLVKAIESLAYQAVRASADDTTS
ncbi:AAA family ATPase [Mycobacterium sp. MBM]|nr:AAA family ATPase [Mycobacterium sp. MBM]